MSTPPNSVPVSVEQTPAPLAPMVAGIGGYTGNRAARIIRGVFLVRPPINLAMFDAPRIADCFVAHPRHSYGYGCGSLRALGARMRLSACTQIYGWAY